MPCTVFFSILNLNSIQLSLPGFFSVLFYTLFHIQTAELLSAPINIGVEEANSLACQI